MTRERLATELREMLLTAFSDGVPASDADGPGEEDDWADPYDDDLEVPRDFEPEAERILLDAVDEILVSGAARPAADVARRLTERERRDVFDLCPGDAPLIGEMVAVCILLGLRHGPGGPDAVEAVRWVADRLGARHARQALRVADLLGHPDAPPWSQVHPPADGDEPLLPALVLLLAGVVGITPGPSAEYRP